VVGDFKDHVKVTEDIIVEGICKHFKQGGWKKVIRV
jgi:hypothetical protein